MKGDEAQATQPGGDHPGSTQISGTGGQLDLVGAARLSKGGRSFIALTSSRQRKEDVASNICFALPVGTAVTTPRAEAQYIVTDYGIADMRQRSLEERARSLIAIAHPDFREGLLQEAQGAGPIRT